MKGKNFSRGQSEIFSLLFQEIGIDIKSQSLFSGENKENLINLLSAEVAHKVA